MEALLFNIQRSILLCDLSLHDMVTKICMRLEYQGVGILAVVGYFVSTFFLNSLYNHVCITQVKVKWPFVSAFSFNSLYYFPMSLAQLN